MHRFTKERSVIDPTLPVNGEGTLSRLTTSWLVFRSVPTRASPRCPALPVTRILIFVRFPSCCLLRGQRSMPYVRCLNLYPVPSESQGGRAAVRHLRRTVQSAKTACHWALV